MNHNHNKKESVLLPSIGGAGGGGISPEAIGNTQEKFYKAVPYSGENTSASKQVITQGQFLCELDPRGHKINDPLFYPDIYKLVDDVDESGKLKGKQRLEKVPVSRVAISMQDMISKKQLIHLCGEKIQFTNNVENYSKEQEKSFVKFKQGWLEKNMETAKYDFCKSVKNTGDGAFCAVMTNGIFSYRIFSVANNETLHPIRDVTGRLRIFGRKFTAFDYVAGTDATYMEVWDDTYYTLLQMCSDNQADKEAQTCSWDLEDYMPHIGRAKSRWFVVKQPVKHGFTSLPIVYLKDPTGACWSKVQDLIDKLEIAISQLYDNNKAYAFRIMKIKGGFSVQGDLDGNARAILLDDEKGDAGFLEKADASSSFNLQLDKTWDFIKLGSFVVVPPDIKGSDITGVAIKIMYSPAIEQGINDKNFYNTSIDRIVQLFKEGYAMEVKQTAQFNKLSIRGEIKIYVHQNDTEVTNSLAIEVNAGIISKETARENSVYCSPDENRRIREQDEYDLEMEIKTERTKLSGITGSTPDDGMNKHNETLQMIAKTA